MNAIIEILGHVDRTGINCPGIGNLPLACAAPRLASVQVQELGMEAAIGGDIGLLKQAMLHDPLVSTVCNPAEVWQGTRKMLVAQSQSLPRTSRRFNMERSASPFITSTARVLKLSATQGAARSQSPRQGNGSSALLKHGHRRKQLRNRK
jgi:alpha-galactosidase